MEALLTSLVTLATISWIGFALLPWGLWRNREVLEAIDGAEGDEPLAEITAVIPARNEAEIIQQTLLSVVNQGPDLQIILIDDGSGDGTAATARRLVRTNLRIM
ncbi:MAG TPA: glycosyltransferase family A protein, partial [Candidatus Binatia bacterium]|nr:glycosyltransferase family A protein [Candidatus Binatia bacterium]